MEILRERLVSVPADADLPGGLLGFRPRWATQAYWHELSRSPWFWAGLGVFLTYWFIISAGTWLYWPMYMTYYDVLADGFRAGHLYSIVGPSKQLLATPAACFLRHFLCLHGVHAG